MHVRILERILREAAKIDMMNAGGDVDQMEIDVETSFKEKN